jgi:hypothetical protein
MRALTGILVALHIVTAITGFGAVVATGVLAAVAARDPASTAAARYFRPGPNWVARSLLLVPLFGAGLEASSGFPDVRLAWPYLALAIWLVAAGVASGVHWPAEQRIQALLASPGGTPAAPATAELVAACRRAEWSGAVLTVAFVAALAVMVVQPR